MQTQGIKEQAHRLLEELPDTATWDDLMHRVYVRQTIEAGIKNSDQARTLDKKSAQTLWSSGMRVHWTHNAIAVLNRSATSPYRAAGFPNFWPTISGS